jgi:ABC-2 type transport system ATP-binding protein
MDQPVAELRSVSKSFGTTLALTETSLEVGRGEVVALLGPNGAGKSTALNLLMGLRSPDKGAAFLYGLDPRDPAARANIGVTPQETSLPENLKVREIIDFVRTHYKAPLSRSEILSRFDLKGLANRQAGGLSGGQKRKLAVALAYAGNAPAVFLDEPTTGLDPEARRALWETAREHVRTGGTLLLTTHYLEEAEALASRVILVDQGRIIRDGTVAEIKASVGVRIVRFVADALPELPEVVRADARMEDGKTLHTLYVRDADAAVRALVASGADFRKLEVLSVSLEEAVFVAPAGSSMSDAP